MKQFFLQAEADGELPRSLQGLLGLVACALAAGCYFIIRAAVPASSALAHAALAAMLVGAPAGFAVLFGFVVKVWQGSRVHVKTQDR